MIYYLPIIILLLSVTFVSGFYYIYSQKKWKKDISAGLGLQLFLVTVPESHASQGNPEEQLKGFIGQMEHFLSGLATLKRKGWSQKIWKNPVFALEIASHNIGSEIFFYIAFPRAYATVLRTQLHGSFPDAKIEPIPQDYNIFNSDGASAIATMKNTSYRLLPLKTYRSMNVDSVETITSAFSKLNEMGEGAAIQILARIPSGNVKSGYQHVVKNYI